MGEQTKNQALKVIQDFYSKRAIAHASFFVASIFGLFSTLSLMRNLLSGGKPFWVWWLLLPSYILIWLFGFYSLANFAYYSAVAHEAQWEISGSEVERLIVSAKKERTCLLRWFFEFKSRCGLTKGSVLDELRERNLLIFFLFYVLLGVMPIAAVLLS